MFEKFFGPKNIDDIERDVSQIIHRELGEAINGPALARAFRAVKEKNEADKLGLTNNHLLNLVKEVAIGQITSMDEALLHLKPEQIQQLVTREIDSIRKTLSPEEQKS